MSVILPRIEPDPPTTFSLSSVSANQFQNRAHSHPLARHTANSGNVITTP